MPKLGQINNHLVDDLKTKNKIYLLEPFKGAKHHHKMKCLVCEHEWVATPISKSQTYKKFGVSGCPQCKKHRLQDSYCQIRRKNISQLNARGIEILTPDYDGRRHPVNERTYSKILVRNVQCGHEFYCSPSNLFTKKVECAICGPQKRIMPLTAWSKQNSTKWRETATEWQKYKADVAKLTRECYKKNKKIINPKNLPRGKAGERGAYHLDHIVPVRFCFENNIPAEMCAHVSNLQMMPWRANVGSRAHIKGTIPLIFHQYLPSYDRLTNYRRSLLTTGYKEFVSIGNTVVDLYNEESKHAIVIIPIDVSQANKKTAYLALEDLTSQNVKCTILFEDELRSMSLVRSKIKHYTNQNDVPRLHARKCIIKRVDKKEKSTFLNTHHIQGNDNSQIAYGAYHGEDLVAVMTFSTPRVGIGVHKNKQQGSFELVRFATNTHYRIPGIASKLLSHFQKNHAWTEIYSYADRRWSAGNLYYQLGFTLQKINPPDYFYIVNGVRKHRWNYRKDIIKNILPTYDASLTEYQNMTSNGYYRIWDCGTLRYFLPNAVNGQ